MAAEEGYLQAVRGLRREGHSFEEIKRILGKRITQAVADVRREEDEAGAPATPPKKTRESRREPPKVPEPAPYSSVRRSGTRVFDRGPVLVD